MKRFKSKRTGLRIDSGLQAVSFSAEVRFHGKQQPAVVSVPSNQLVAMQLANDPSNSAVTPTTPTFANAAAKRSFQNTPRPAKLAKPIVRTDAGTLSCLISSANQLSIWKAATFPTANAGH